MDRPQMDQLRLQKPYDPVTPGRSTLDKRGKARPIPTRRVVLLLTTTRLLMRRFDITILAVFGAGLAVTPVIAPIYLGVVVPLSLAGVVGYVWATGA